MISGEESDVMGARLTRRWKPLVSLGEREKEEGRKKGAKQKKGEGSGLERKRKGESGREGKSRCGRRKMEPALWRKRHACVAKPARARACLNRPRSFSLSLLFLSNSFNQFLFLLICYFKRNFKFN